MMNKPHILMDDCMGGYLVTKHLIELGHKHILGIFKLMTAREGTGTKAM